MKPTRHLATTGVSLLTLAAILSLGGSASASGPTRPHRDLVSAPGHVGPYLPPYVDKNPNSKSGTWTDVNGPILPSIPEISILLTDGRVMVHSACTGHWYFLTPDKKGKYETGSWSQDSANLPAGYAPGFFGSEILPDGRFIMNGGEYNGKNCINNPVWTNLGALYDPVADSWTAVSPPSGWSSIGDAQSIVLPDGTYMLANCCDNPGFAALASISGTNVTWTKQETVACAEQDFCNNEESWNLLPDGDALTVDVHKFGSNYDDVEIYNTSSGTWSLAGKTADYLSDSGFEIGPAVLRPDGTIIQFGANTTGGFNDLYTVSTGKWRSAPSFPMINGVQFLCYDAPAALLPDGNVIVQASPPNAVPSHFFEFSLGKKGTMALTQVNDPISAPHIPSYVGSFLELPTGQVLWANEGSEVATYTPKGNAKKRWLPVVSSVASNLTVGSIANAISGTNFNGLSQGASYGDDKQMATNYPLVRVTNNGSGNVCFGRSYDFSTMGVWTQGTTNAVFDLPTTCETGASTLQVIVNGLASTGVSVTLKG